MTTDYTSKQTTRDEENPMHTPVNHHNQAEEQMTRRVTCRQTNTSAERPETAPFITLMGSDSTPTPKAATKQSGSATNTLGTGKAPVSPKGYRRIF